MIFLNIASSLNSVLFLPLDTVIVVSDVNPLSLVVALSRKLCRACTHACQPYISCNSAHTDESMRANAQEDIYTTHLQACMDHRHPYMSTITTDTLYRFAEGEKESETCHPPVRSSNNFKVFLSAASATRPPCWTLKNNHLNVSQSALLPSSITPFQPYICIIF